MTQNGGTAMSRGDWQSAGGQILTQSSCVNVAAEASLNISTRVLTVDVEAYYTDTSTSATNKINVVLLQNNVEGPQTGGATWNPGQMLPNGNYNHQHMFRHLLTGQWGDDITNTTTGSLFQNTYTYTIPADLNGVAYDLFNLDVAVFVAEGNQEVLTGNMSNMTHIPPPGINLIDLSATTNMSMPASYCDNVLIPEITVTNNSGIAVDTFEVSHTLNSNAPITQAVYTSLSAGATTTIIFPSITLPAGTNRISYSVLTMAGTSFMDNMPNNNLASSGSFNTLSATAFATTHTEGFDNYSTGSATMNNGIIENPNNTNTYVVDNSISSSVTWPLGGFGNSSKSYRFRFFSWNPGDYVNLIWEKLDFSNTTGNKIKYSYAHAQSTGFDNNRLQVFVSNDCGATWTQESQLIGTTLATAPINSSSHFYPTINDWASHTVDLSTYDGNTEVMISIKVICAGGNNLYIDDIEIGDNIVSAISENSTDNIVANVYPNPTNEIGTLQLNIENTTSLDIAIFDVLGKKVQQMANTKFTKGRHNISFDTTNLESGTYFIKCQSNEMVNNVKFVVAH